MLRLCGCEIASGDASRLVDMLRADGSPEAAQAIRWGSAFECSTDRLERDIGEAITRVLRDIPVNDGLSKLRVALASCR